MNIAVFRKDKKNVGDWWSVPSSYLPMTIKDSYDLAKPNEIPNDPGVVILGGGGLGRKDFEPCIRSLLRPDRKYRVIGWGIGSDSLTLKGQVLPAPINMQELLGYFDGLDEIGTRIFPDGGIYPDSRYCWVPCASCLSPLFDELRPTQVEYRTCVYEHLREPLLSHISSRSRLWNRIFGPHRLLTNRGVNLKEKLRFMAKSEFVITNSYHGVYWGTLLGKRVVCVPFKNGLFSFKHAPSYLDADGLESAMDRAKVNNDALHECREANHAFYRRMKEKYGEL